MSRSSAAPASIVIEPRFHGPPNSGNGGYVCGLLAALMPGNCVVRLRQPPPLGKPLDVQTEADSARLLCDGGVVATAMPSELEVDVPTAPTTAQALSASTRFVGFEHHVFPTCFVCGTEREPGDGLRLFTGPVAGAESGLESGQNSHQDLVACGWTPDVGLAAVVGGEPQSYVSPEFVWAALDCPGAFALALEPAPEGSPKLILLGELGVNIRASVPVGEPTVVVGWKIETQGRKHRTGTALYTERGECLAAGLATWIEVDQVPKAS